MNHLVFTTNYVDSLCRTVPAVLSEQQSFDLSASTFKTAGWALLGAKHSIHSEETERGVRLWIEVIGEDKATEIQPLFDDSWLDVDVAHALTSPSAQVSFLQDGQIQIESTQGVFMRLAWLLAKGASELELAAFMESFVFSLCSRPKELDIETFSPSETFSAWKREKRKALTVERQTAGHQFKESFHTLQMDETTELLVDALKGQKVAGWRHWSVSSTGEVDCRNMLKRYWQLSPEESRGLDLESGVIVSSGQVSRAELAKLQEFSGLPYHGQEVVLAHIGFRPS